MPAIITILIIALIVCGGWIYHLTRNQNNPNRHQNSSPVNKCDSTITSTQENFDNNINVLSALQQQVGALKQTIENYAVRKEEAEGQLEEIKGMVLGEQLKLDAAVEAVETKANELEELEERKEELKAALEMVTNRLSHYCGVSHDAVIRSRNALEGRGVCLGLDEREIFELERLEEVVPLLKNPLALNKAIYEIYLRDKIKRINELQGTSGKCGIYRIYVEEKIPNSDEVAVHCYVGQAVNIADRWTTHLKRLVGAEEGTRVVFYKEARKFLPWLKWEVLELCDRSILNEREHYWIEFYGGISDWNMKG